MSQSLLSGLSAVVGTLPCVSLYLHGSLVLLFGMLRPLGRHPHNGLFVTGHRRDP